MKKLLLILIYISLGCQPQPPDKQILIDKYYEQKRADLANEKNDVCREKIINEVQFVIDSLIDTWVNAKLIDTIQFPLKPQRPIKPPAIINSFDKFSLDSLPEN